jgi:hypothetical protein
MRRSFVSAASIHAHTHFSRENLSFLPHYAAKIPGVASRVQRSVDRYKVRTGRDLDFGAAYWTPPFSPEQVLASEIRQIEDRLGLAALVSLTDHDSFDAPFSLGDGAPLSTEWTVPFQGTYLHVGIHNLDAAIAHKLIPELHRFTQGTSTASAADLFACLQHSPGTLVVLNHPLWDIERSTKEDHGRMLLGFLGKYHRFLHALEINGFRPWEENREVLALGETWGLPVVAGGDRHGAAPNMVLNLTTATSLSEFAAEVREDRISDVVLMPAYHDPMFTKQFRTAGDALGFYPNHPPERRHWTGRVFFEEIPGQPKSMKELVSTGIPGWLETTTSVVRSLGGGPLHRLLNASLPRERIQLPDPSCRDDRELAETASASIQGFQH